MASNRLFIPNTPLDTPLEILKSHMRNPEEHKRLVDSSTALLKQRLLNRALNNFPLLISPEELDNQTSTFIDIVKYVSCTSTNDDVSMRELDTFDKDELKNAVTHIALIGCNSLLKDSKAHPDLIALLKWQQFQSMIDISDLISAFTGETFLAIIKNASLKMDIDINASSLVTDFISKNLRSWVIDAIHQTGHEYIDTRVSVKTHDDQIHHNNTAGVVAAAAIAGFLLLGSVATAAILAEKSYSPRMNHRR